MSYDNYLEIASPYFIRLAMTISVSGSLKKKTALIAVLKKGVFLNISGSLKI
ncbi:MAG: hypothetical protein J5680_03950 [Neisseriaceae bacterium]|nr:hypothetical protein [Neisseriaceae bacterium]